MELDLPQVGETWRHFKGGDYKIVGFAWGAEGVGELELRVLYATAAGVEFSRGLVNFIGPVDTRAEARFTKVHG